MGASPFHLEKSGGSAGFSATSRWRVRSKLEAPSCSVSWTLAHARSAKQEARCVPWLLILHDLDFPGHGIELVPQEASAAKRAEVEEQESPSRVLFDKRAHTLLDTPRERHDVRSRLEAFAAKISIRSKKKRASRHAIGPQVLPDVGLERACDADPYSD